MADQHDLENPAAIVRPADDYELAMKEREIKRAVLEAEQSLKSGIDRIRNIAKQLIEYRKRMPDDKFVPWAMKATGKSARTIRRWIRLVQIEDLDDSVTALAGEFDEEDEPNYVPPVLRSKPKVKSPVEYKDSRLWSSVNTWIHQHKRFGQVKCCLNDQRHKQVAEHLESARKLTQALQKEFGK